MAKRDKSASSPRKSRSRAKSLLIRAVMGLAATAIIVLGVQSYSQPGKYDQFAQCLTDKGAKFYGAFWCPHCQAQKRLFGKSAKLLPYVECSTPDGKGKLAVCKDNGVEGYPTWEFADGTRKTGEVPLAELAITTSCPLPE
jgi:thiol-disulfide isomerase/thioredoxin